MGCDEVIPARSTLCAVGNGNIQVYVTIVVVSEHCLLLQDGSLFHNHFAMTLALVGIVESSKVGRVMISL